MTGEQQGSDLVRATVTGNIATVDFNPETVTLTSSMGRDALNHKIENEKLFRSLTSGIPGLYHPLILSEDPVKGKYEIERATGFNLACSGFIQGNMTDFFDIPVSFKTETMLTYLRAITKINRVGYSLRDHKSDSVFIDPEKKQISVVDTDPLRKANGNPWKEEVNAGLSEKQLRRTLRSFFTRGLQTQDQSEDSLIPAGINIVLNRLESYSSADEVITELEQWKRGKQGVIQYGGYLKSSPGKHFELLLQTNKVSDKLRKEIEEMDINALSDYERDQLEAIIYTQDFVNEPVLKDLFG